MLIVPVPRTTFSFLNVTVPVAVAGVTVAVKVTFDSYGEGFSEEDIATEELCWFTVCLKAEEVLL